MRSRIRAEAADRPGVYRMLAADGEIVYVGKSKQLRTRLLSYFRGEFPEDKGARILRETDRIEWDYVPSEFAALLAELRLIKKCRPRFNVAMKRDGRNYCFIKLIKGPAPKLAVVRGPGEDETSTYYGPFLGAVGVGDAVRELSDLLGLRDCAESQRMHFADQPELFDNLPRTPGCIRFEVKKCLGPCVGGCSVRAYGQRVKMAQAFLDGDDDGPLEQLETQMVEASERMEYERAASVRDKLHRLEALRGQFARLRFAVETLSFVYSVPGFDGDDRVYFIRRGRVHDEAAPPKTPADAAEMLERIEEVFGTPEPNRLRIPTHEIDELLLVSSWFSRYPKELDRTSVQKA